MVELNGTHEKLDGLDVVWQIPPNPKGVLFIAHSANISPLSYWPPTPSAPKCTGTPEQKLLVKRALERGYAVIAGDSAEGGEWDGWPTTKPDIQNMVKLLEWWRSKHGLEDLPLFGLGSSNGGDFISSLATVVDMKALVIMISHGRSEALESAVAGKYPPVLWVTMIKDDRTFTAVKEEDKALKEKGVPSAIVEVHPLEVHQHFFEEYIDEIDEEQSSKLHAVFVEHGIVKDNLTEKAPMAHDIEPFLRIAAILPPGDDAQRKKDQEKIDALKRGESARQGPPHAGPPHEGPPHEGPPHGGRGGRGGRGPPQGGRVSGRGGPPPPEGGIGGGPGTGPPPPPGGIGGGPGAGPPPPTGGRGGGPGKGPPGGGPPGGGPPGGGPPPSHPIANGVSNQLRVAQGKHTLTARHSDAIFDWFEGKGWF